MTGSLSKVGLWAALALPFIGVVALVLKAEVAVCTGPSFHIPIRGYDPRDLLQGHYFSYQYDFNWQGEDSCTQESIHGTDTNLRRGCCLCLTRVGASESNPRVRQVNCSEREQHLCAGWLRADDVAPPQKYFIPENRGHDLESALNSRRATIEIVTSTGGPPAVKGLYVDGRPWQAVVGAGKAAK